MILMLTHPGEEIKETLAAGDLFRMRVEIPSHLVGKPVSSLNVEGKILVAGVDRGGKGFIPVASSTFQEGDYAAVVVQKDALELLEELLQPIGDH
jgi:Trk K+ transport system NAD-binding subunit